MSLDVYLSAPHSACACGGICPCHQDGDDRTEFYSTNITHNLGRMADAAGIYYACWRPDEVGITKAAQLIQPLTEGLAKLKEKPVYYQTFNCENGWGLYENFVPWVERYLEACKNHPDADVRVSR